MRSTVENALEKHDIECKEIFFDGSLIVIEVDDPVTTAPIVADLFGVDKVAIADQVSNKFSDIVAGIVNVGKKIINSGEAFAVRVDAANTEYVGRDVEFAAPAGLRAELTNLNVKSVDQQLCNKLIYAHATQKSAYVCIFTDERSERTSCWITNGSATM